MAISSFPFDNQDTTETQFSKLFRELQASGVADTFGGSACRVDPTGGMGVAVQPGFAIVRGHGFLSDAAEPLTLPAAGGSTVIHTIVLRLDPSINTIVPAVISGVGGGGAPALTQTDSAVYELPLFDIEVAPSSANIDPTKMIDRRPFLANPPMAWSMTSRPVAPRFATLGYNASISQWEFYNGVEWKAVVDPSLNDRVTSLETQPWIRRTNARNLSNGTSTIQNQESTPLSWTASDGGSGVAYDPATGRFTPSKPGTYSYEVQITFETSEADAGRRILNLLRNTTLVDIDIREGTDGSYTTLRVSGEVSIAAGQYLRADVYIYAGGFLPMINGLAYQKFQMRRVGP